MIDRIVEEDVKAICGKLSEHHFSGKSILVTGGAGFLGSWIVDILLELGARVTCLDNLSTGMISSIDHNLDDSQFRFVQGDVISFNGNQRYDYLLHLASRASPEEYQQRPIDTLLANSLGNQRMLELARKMDSRLIYASSSEVYGDAQVIPTPEGYWGYVNPVGPRSCYDEGKRFGEALITAYKKEYDVDARIARIFNTYGPRIRATGCYARVVPRFIRQALTGEPITVYGNGSQTRSFCYVADTILGLLSLLSATNAQGAIINIGASQETTILDLANTIRKLTGSKSQIAFSNLPIDDPTRRCPNIQEAKRILDWSPTVSQDDGLKKTIEWFRKNQDR